MTSEEIEAAQKELYASVIKRDQEVQSAIWALLFVVADLSLAFRSLRDVLTERGGLLPEDEKKINTLAVGDERMQAAYAHLENAFNEKFSKLMEVAEDPEKVEKEMSQQGIILKGED